jgi:hypothetical protein
MFGPAGVEPDFSAASDIVTSTSSTSFLRTSTTPLPTPRVQAPATAASTTTTRVEPSTSAALRSLDDDVAAALRTFDDAQLRVDAVLAKIRAASKLSGNVLDEMSLFATSSSSSPPSSAPAASSASTSSPSTASPNAAGSAVYSRQLLDQLKADAQAAERDLIAALDAVRAATGRVQQAADAEIASSDKEVAQLLAM